MTELAHQLCDREIKIANAEGILEPQDLVSVFTLAATMTVLRLESVDKALAEEMGAAAVRSLINNMLANGIDLKL